MNAAKLLSQSLSVGKVKGDPYSVLAIAMEPNTQASQIDALDDDKFATSEANPVNDPETAASNASEAKPSFGWNRYAERVNGRFAMLGFIALLVLELFTHQDFFTWLGF